MFKIEVHREGQKSLLETKDSDFLQVVLRNAGYNIYSPCGGNGTCGKCKVWIRGEGSVASCVFPVTEDLEVIIPDRKEAQILIDQHRYTVELPLQPGHRVKLSNNPHGIAIDIGTTSLVFYLVDLITGAIVETRAEENPQTNYGADVISRINYAAQNEHGLQELQDTLIHAINSHLEHFTELMDLRHEDIVKISVSGNTTMLHLLLGVDPLPLALAPFTPRFIERQKVNAEDLKLKCHPDAVIETLPGISAYVGADIVAGLASIAPQKEFGTYLFMDIGTNGELALVTPDRIICCATAAGPAFEGARIKYGMTAIEGAISSYGRNGYSVIGDVTPTGICGSGLIDVIGYMVEHGHVHPDGLIDEDFVIVEKEYSGINESIAINQQDIREVQLAKAAIATGVNILLNKAGIMHGELDAVFLAGGFGNHINSHSAITIGLLSPIFKDKIISLGNTSGTGAVLSLKSTSFSDIMNKVILMAKHLELSEEPDFAMEFAMNMMFDYDRYHG
jgi:uncharacterized 2Fe-2S/4Fe-4S cluster protein (DUF4445 family)